MLKKANLLSSLNSLQTGGIAPNLTSWSTSPCARPSVTYNPPKEWRSYADVHSSKGPDFRDNMHWPGPKAHSTTPTPYEIFELDRGAVYSKRKFYELVKIYHPDRNSHDGSSGLGITHVEMLERYRLVVLANEILSDPVKRRAYDSYGAGWNEVHGGRGRTSTRHTRGYYSATGDKPYGHGVGCDSSPFSNATWEDWERWYRRAQGPTKQQAYQGNYINPNAFASFVILMAVVTGIAQATRAGQYSGSLDEKAKECTAEASRFLTSRVEHYNENKLSSSGRIKHFLEKRDPSRDGLRQEEEETYRKYFAPKPLAPPNIESKSDRPD